MGTFCPSLNLVIWWRYNFVRILERIRRNFSPALAPACWLGWFWNWWCQQMLVIVQVTSVLFSWRYLKNRALIDPMFLSANTDLVSLQVEERWIPDCWQKLANSGAISRLLSTQFFVGFGDTGLDPQRNRGCKTVGPRLLPSMTSIRACRHDAAIFRFSETTHTNRLSVSTAAKRDVIPWLNFESCCISAKSIDQISLSP